METSAVVLSEATVATVAATTLLILGGLIRGVSIAKKAWDDIRSVKDLVADVDHQARTSRQVINDVHSEFRRNGGQTLKDDVVRLGDRIGDISEGLLELRLSKQADHARIISLVKQVDDRITKYHGSD